MPDDVLEELVSGLAAAGHIQTGHLLVHTSGRYGTDVLRSVREHGAIPVAIHPAMTFTGTSLDVDRLHNTAFGITADAVVAPIAEALVVEMVVSRWPFRSRAPDLSCSHGACLKPSGYPHGPSTSHARSRRYRPRLQTLR